MPRGKAKKEVVTRQENISKRVNILENQLQMGLQELQGQIPRSDSDSEEVVSFVQKLKHFEKLIKDGLDSIKNDISQVTNNLHKIENVVDAAQKEDFLNALIVKGVPEEDQENIGDVTCKLLASKLNVEISLSDINYCHRMGKKGTQHCRPVRIQFVNRWFRDVLFSKKKLLKGSRIVVYEMLTKNTRNLYKKACDKFNFKNCWTWKGNVYVNNNNSKKLITSETDLINL